VLVILFGREKVLPITLTVFVFSIKIIIEIIIIVNYFGTFTTQSLICLSLMK
jgi:hypothetical protein